MNALLTPPVVKEQIEKSEQILCYYFNGTSQLQVARISNIPGWYFERVVFPGQRLMFEAPSQGWLEVYTGKGATVMLDDRISCKNLRTLEN